MSETQNLWENILQNPISSTPDTNIVKGQVIEISNINSSVEEALQEALTIIPPNEFALTVIDNTQITDESIEKLEDFFQSEQVGRPTPEIYSKSNDCQLKQWFGEPEKRENDLCIVGTNHRCQGIQTRIVIHIIPQHCPDCGHSNKDPIIASRATAMYIIAKYI